MDALQDNTVIHMFGDTTLEFHETYIYVNEKFRRENPRVPMIPSETENDFFKMCKVFGPPSQHERWCCTIFKTSNLNKEYENLPGNSLTFWVSDIVNPLQELDMTGHRKYQRFLRR